MGKSSFRQHRRAKDGVDAAVQELLYKITLATAPIWVPLLGIYFLFQAACGS
jgi:hypothetical protein